MRVLLDECVDWRLLRDLTGFDVKTARQMGWSEVKNGKLLRLASEHFDVFVTVDRNLSFQNKVIDLPLAVVVLCAPTNRLADLRVLLPEMSAAILSAVKGQVVLVGR
jgi:hypothetical protein